MNLIEFVRIMSLGFIYEFWGFCQLIVRNVKMNIMNVN